ncbi:MAG: hypothetical protein JSV86_10635 [Gemmatimonadota bacterium]|nr:MAG: hypothetical protein JSV86_10635 [Gemmatimonadota bacterium]
MRQATLVGPLGLEVIEHEYTVGPPRPGLDGLGVISQQDYWSSARSGGQNGLGIAGGREIQVASMIIMAGAGAAGAAAIANRRGSSATIFAGVGGAAGALIAGYLANLIIPG